MKTPSPPAYATKYPRTFHLPWSEGATSDDKTLVDDDVFQGKRVVVTEKMDGENTSMYTDYIHARSIDSRHHPSRDWVKSYWDGIRADIPIGWRVCGENVYARHSVPYDSLPSYFLGFSIWNSENVCLSWAQTLEYFSLLGVTPVRVLHEGVYNAQTIQSLYPQPTGTTEGYVVRLYDEFHYEDFPVSVAKFVRANHVTTDTHWAHARVVPNKLA